MNITLVTLPDSQIKQQGLYTEITAGVVIENIDTTGSNDTETLVRARDAVYASYPFFPGHPELRLFNILLKGFNTNSMTGVMVFQSSQFDVVSAAFVRFTGYSQTQETNLVPGLRIPIKVGWVGEPKTITLEGGNQIGIRPEVAPDLVTMRFSLPALCVSISGLMYGSPPTQFQEGVAYLNNAAWPSSVPTIIKSKPKAYWKIDKYETAFSKYRGYYTYEAVATSRVFADWSETGVLVNRQSGRYVKVSQANIDAMNAKEYKHGIIYPDTEGIDPGIVRVGGNPLIDFPSVFGFN